MFYHKKDVCNDHRDDVYCNNVYDSTFGTVYTFCDVGSNDVFDSNDKVYMAYSISSFLKAWERSRRLAYVAEKIK